MIGYPSRQDHWDSLLCSTRVFVFFLHTISLLLTKLDQSRWQILALFFVCMFMELDSLLVRKDAKKLGRYPAILTSHFAKNSYVLFRNNIYPGEVTWVCNITWRLAIIGEYFGICLMIQQNAHNSTMAPTGSPWQSLKKRFSQKDYFKHVKVFKHFSFCEMIKTQQDSFNTKHFQREANLNGCVEKSLKWL